MRPSQLVFLCRHYSLHVEEDKKNNKTFFVWRTNAKVASLNSRDGDEQVDNLLHLLLLHPITTFYCAECERIQVVITSHDGELLWVCFMGG